MASNKQISIDVEIEQTVTSSISLSSLARELELDDVKDILRIKDYDLDECFKLIIEYAETKNQATKSFIMSQNLTLTQADKLNDFLKTLKD